MVEKKYPMSDAVFAAYDAGEEDEALEPITRVDANEQPIGRIQDGDYVIFYDIRGEREIELTSAFVESEFPHFQRKDMKVHFATMIEYAKDLPVKVAFPPLGEVRNTLSEVVSKHNLRQCKLTESEKSIHVSYFFNGKLEEKLPGEDRITIPSPEVANYAEIPEMHAAKVADAVIDALENPEYNLIVVNFVNVDVVGHIENKQAVMRAVQEVDRCVGKVITAAHDNGVTPVVTADHGTVEKWLYPDGTVDTGHSDSLVPFILADPELADTNLYQGTSLTDVAPTVLRLMNLPIPEEMTGNCLVPAQLEHKQRRVLIVIVDGWGLREEEYGNMIKAAHTPYMDSLLDKYPHTKLQASGIAVGMPAGTVGNSESGHSHIGAGRRILADRVRINESIEDGTFFENEAFRWAMQGAIRDRTRLHLLGIVSFYSSHGSVAHLNALLEMTRREGVEEVYHHAMLGRRGEHLGSGAHYIKGVEEEMERLATGKQVSIIGRFWSLDREYNWDRIEKTYKWLVDGSGTTITTP